MAIGIHFDKAKAEHFLDCLPNGKPIQPQDPRGWTCDDMLALAGACYLGAQSHGPALYQNTDWSKVPKERREVIDETFDQDIHGAIEWLAQATRLVQNGEYDQYFEPQHKAIVINAEERKEIIPVAGFRKTA